MEEMVNLIVSNGMAVVIIAYFLYKDYKFNQSILNALGEMSEVLGGVKEVLAALQVWHAKEDTRNG